MMWQIRVHGRAGQGAKTLAHLAAQTAFRAGWQVQAFPEYGPERSGAPLKTYLRISDRPIRIIEAINRPDTVVVLDRTLLRSEAVYQGIGAKTVLLCDCEKTLATKQGESAQGLNAVLLAKNTAGERAVSTVLFGALCRLRIEILRKDEAAHVIMAHFSNKNPEAQIEAFWAGYNAR